MEISAFNKPLDFKSDVIKNKFSYFSTKTYVVGTQKSRLNEMVFFEPSKHVKIDGYIRKYSQFYTKFCVPQQMCLRCTKT